MTTPTVHRGIVKQVLSGDCLVIRDRPKGGPPPERTVALSNIVAPRLARRPPANTTGERFLGESKDEPCAWACREFLRKKVIGREVCFVVEHKIASGREYGYIYIGKDTSCENVAESIVTEGLAEVRRGTSPALASNEQYQKLVQLEEAARAAGKGKWSPTASSEVRQCLWAVENPVTFVESRHTKPLSAIVEHVRDGCTYRLCILPHDKDPNYTHVTLMLSGIKTPTFKNEGDEQKPEDYAEEARYFVETRLLQREVQVKLETSSNANLVGSVLHPNGNIAELLLKEGYARCVDWSMGSVSSTGGAEVLRAAQQAAKEKRLRLWKDWVAPVGFVGSVGENGETGAKVTGEFTGNKTVVGKVVEVGNADIVFVKTQDGKVRKFFLSSIRPPRPVVPAGGQPPVVSGGGSNKTRSRPLYDVPYMFEAREFLRKKLIGKKVNVRIDYVQPKNETGMDERVCATVQVGDINVAEALVSKGLAGVVRYRATDENRSASYDLLLAAEAVAQKKAVGIHSKKENKPLRITDMAGDVNKAKNFLPFLQRAGRLEAIVEFVAGGSRMRLYVPKESCLITLLLAGIDCPRAPRRNPDGTEEGGDSFGTEAYLFSKEQCMQREVEIEVESMDKGGNFIGWLFLDAAGAAPGSTSNLSVALVENGLAKVHFSAEKSNYFTALARAEDKAKESKLNIWTLDKNKKEVLAALERAEEIAAGDEDGDATGENGKSDPGRKTSYKKALAAVVSPGLHFYAQYVDSEKQIERIQRDLASHFTEHPPLAGVYTPRKGDLCAAKFVDDCWYRARVKACTKSDTVTVFYVDFGNEEVTTSSRLASLPPGLASMPGEAHEMRLAFTRQPPDEEDKIKMDDAFIDYVAEKEVKVNIEYDHPDGGKAVTVLIPSKDGDLDVLEPMLRDGYVWLEPRKDRRLSKLMAGYQTLQNEAMRSRRNIWCYGDFREDDAL